MDIDFFGSAPDLSDLTLSEDTYTCVKEDPQLGSKLVKIATDLHNARVEYRRTWVEKVASSDNVSASDAKSILEDAAAPASVVLLAAKNLLGPAIGAWEPQTIYTSLDKEGIQLPPVNGDKLMAAITISETPAFYLDAGVFSSIVHAFNDVEANPDILQETTPAHICWAVYEAELILHEANLFEPSFDYEPVVYIAGTLQQAGMILAPTILGFAQAELTKLTKAKSADIEKVREAWRSLSKNSLTSHTFSESAVDVQLAKLAACHVYLNDRADTYTQYLRKVSAETIK